MQRYGSFLSAYKQNFADRSYKKQRIFVGTVHIYRLYPLFRYRSTKNKAILVGTVQLRANRQLTSVNMKLFPILFILLYSAPDFSLQSGLIKLFTLVSPEFSIICYTDKSGFISTYCSVRLFH